MTSDRLIAWLHEGVDLLGDWLKDAPQSRLELDTNDFGTPPPSVLNPATRRAVEALQDELIASQLAPTPKRRRRPRKYEPRVPVPIQVPPMPEVFLGQTGLYEREESQPDAQTYHCTHCGRVLPATVRQYHEPNCAAAEKGYTTHESRKPDGSSAL